MAKKKIERYVDELRENGRRSFETFRELSNFQTNNLIDEKPYCFNGMVSVRRYRVTIELIDEPKDIIAERLKKLWRESDNHHHFHPLMCEALRQGVELNWDDFKREYLKPKASQQPQGE